MITIALHGAKFFAHHGFYPEEQKLGSHFIVDIEVSFWPEGDISNDDIANTVNYEQLYEIAAQEIKQTRKLIETVAHSIMDQIKNHYPGLESILVSIKKLNPALGGTVGCSSITINYTKA